MDLQQIKELALLMQQTGLTSLHLTEGAVNIQMERAGTAAAVCAQPIQTECPQPPQEAAKPQENPKPQQEGHKVLSPMVGVFYSAPSPQSKPFVEVGSRVKKGDVLVVLSNTSLTLEILNSEAELAEKQNILRNTLISMEQEKLSLRQDKAQLDLDVSRKKRAWQQNEELYRNALIAREEWLQSKEDYELAEKKRELNIERQVQDSLYRSVQIEQMEENLDNMKRNMQLIRERIGNLNVKSPIDGEVGLLDIVLGQSVSTGQKIGQINDLSDYKVEAQIDESYIDRVRAGLEATFDRQGTDYKVRLRKVYPEVRSGQFRADFTFLGDHPENIRSGQTYYLHLELGQPTEAVIIPRGSFYQTTGGAWIYVLAPEGDKAYKRPIRIGRQNPQYYEVLDGLEPGERVIVSGYENYGSNDVLILNK